MKHREHSYILKQNSKNISKTHIILMWCWCKFTSQFTFHLLWYFNYWIAKIHELLLKQNCFLQFDTLSKCISTLAFTIISPGLKVPRIFDSVVHVIISKWPWQSCINKEFEEALTGSWQVGSTTPHNSLQSLGQKGMLSGYRTWKQLFLSIFFIN